MTLHGMTYVLNMKYDNCR